MMKSFLIVSAAIYTSIHCKVCKDVEMVYDGTFDEPQIYYAWTIVGSLNGGAGVWKSVPPSNGFDLWQQGAMGAPEVTPDGQPTGQNLDINGNQAWAQISYQFNLPCLLHSQQATFSFLYWYPPDSNVYQFGYSVEQEGLVISQQDFSDQHTNEWTSFMTTMNVKACQPLTLYFTSDAWSTAGVHIDNVSLITSVCSDVEMVNGGDFELPQITKNWQTIEAFSGKGGIWVPSLATPGFMIWKAGALGSPKLTSQNVSTGQHLEVNSFSNKAQITYQFFVPYLHGTAQANLSLNYLFGARNQITYFGVQVQQGDELVLDENLQSVDQWSSMKYSFELVPGQPVVIAFVVNSVTLGGAHIDNVSLGITEQRKVIPQDPQYDLTLQDFKLAKQQ